MSWFKIGHSARARRKRSDGGRNGLALAQARGVADHVEFHTVDAAGPLPFSSASFDAIVSNDAMCHIKPRLDVLREWNRVLRPAGQALFTDAMVITGLISHEELATRSSRILFICPAGRESAAACRGFDLRSVNDLTDSLNAADVSKQWFACVRTLSVERRLSRYCYLVKKI
jgi:SAM-dependent methyltransferase